MFLWKNAKEEEQFLFLIHAHGIRDNCCPRLLEWKLSCMPSQRERRSAGGYAKSLAIHRSICHPRLVGSPDSLLNSALASRIR